MHDDDGARAGDEEVEMEIERRATTSSMTEVLKACFGCRRRMLKSVIRSMILKTKSVLCLNFCRAGCKRFLRNLREMIHLYKADLVAVLKPRISSERENQVYRKIGRRNWFRVEAKGFSRKFEFCRRVVLLILK